MSTSSKELDQLFERELYLYFHEDFLSDQRTAAECAFIQKSCNLKPKQSILDLACGHGRHANLLASRGLNLTAIDINTQFIEQAKTEAQVKGLNVDYIEKDILELDYHQTFDSVLLLFNSLGFFDRKDAKLLLSKISNALKIGGKAFIDTKNRDHLLKEITPCYLTERGKDLMIDRLSFDPVSGTTTNKRIYVKDGKRYDAPFTMTAYNYTDCMQMLEGTDLKITQVFGSWKGEGFNQDSRRIILILEKVA